MYDCHVVYCRTSFNSTDNQPITDTVHITCGGVEDSYYPSTVYEEHWRVTYPNNEEAVVIEEEKEFTKCYLTNTNNEKINDYKKDDIIVLNIQTLNRIGDNVTVNLEDHKYDFEHNGIVLQNDTLENIVINDDLEQIELKVVEQKNKN